MATEPKPHANPEANSAPDTRDMLADAPMPETREPPPYPVSFEAFHDWMDEDTHAEWVDGEVVMTSPASLRHQQIKMFLTSLLTVYVKWKNLGLVLDNPFMMKLPRSAREPDITFIATAHLARLRPTYLDGPADLVVEIVSPESVDRDYRVKLAEYAAAGVPEYLLIDPLTNSVNYYRTGADGNYAAVQPQHGRLESSVLPGFWLDPAWLAQDPLPDPQATLLQIGGEAYRRYALGQLGL